MYSSWTLWPSVVSLTLHSWNCRHGCMWSHNDFYQLCNWLFFFFLSGYSDPYLMSVCEESHQRYHLCRISKRKTDCNFSNKVSVCCMLHYLLTSILYSLESCRKESFTSDKSHNPFVFFVFLVTRFFSSAFHGTPVAVDFTAFNFSVSWNRFQNLRKLADLLDGKNPGKNLIQSSLAYKQSIC